MFALIIVRECCILKALYPLKLFCDLRHIDSPSFNMQSCLCILLKCCGASSGQNQQNKFEFIGKFTLSAVTWCLLSCLFAQLLIMLNCQVKIKGLVLCQVTG